MAGNANSGRRPGFKHLENTRQKIKFSTIVNRLQADFMAEIDETLLDRSIDALIDAAKNAPDKIEDAKKAVKSAFKKRPLTPGQRATGFGLLAKGLPDLQSITLAGDPDRPLVTEIRETIVDPKG